MKNNCNNGRKLFNQVLLWGLLVLNILLVLLVGPVWNLICDITPFPVSIEKTWIFWLFIPIPLLAMILGIINLCKKRLLWVINAVVGFIVSGLLFVLGCFCLLFPSYRVDYKDVSEYNNILDGILFKDGIFTKEMHDSYFDSDKTNVDIIHAYYEDKNIVKKIEETIKESEYWIVSSKIKTELNVLVPFQMQSFEDDNYYYLFYIDDIKEYNIIPDADGVYRVIVARYDSKDYELEINEFDFEFK